MSYSLVETSCNIPQHILDQHAARQKVAAKNHDVYAVEGEMNVTFLFVEWLLKKQQGGKTQIDRSKVGPPARVMLKGKNGPYPAKLEFYAILKSISPLEVDGKVRRRTDGKPGWEIRVAQSYGEGVEEWLKRHVDVIYNNDVTIPGVKYIDLRNFITEEGDLVQHRWVPISPDTRFKFKTSDNDDTLYRKPFKNGYLVGPGSKIKGQKLSFECFMALKDVPVPEEEQIEGGPKSRSIPSNYTWVNIKGRSDTTADDNPDLPLPDKMHHIENKDVMPFVDIDLWRSGEATPASNVYTYYTKAYGSPESVPEEERVFVLADTVKDHDISYGDERKRNYRFQHSSKKGNFSVKLIAFGEQQQRVADAYNIPSTELYAPIMTNRDNWNINAHIRYRPWEKSILNAENNQPGILGTLPDETHINGYITGIINEVIADYKPWAKHNAIRISRDRAIAEFDSIASYERGSDKIKAMPLEPIDKTFVSPLPNDVVMLGNCQENDQGVAINHFYNGNAWPFIRDGTCYAMTSQTMTPEERSSCVGPDADPEAGADVLDAHIANGAKYVLFVVMENNSTSNDDVDKESVAPVQVGKKRSRDLDQEEEEEEFEPEKKSKSADSDDEQDEEEEEEKKPAGSKRGRKKATASSSSSKKKKKTTRKR